MLRYDLVWSSLDLLRVGRMREGWGRHGLPPNGGATVARGPGKAVTIHDVARHTGVSAASISRVLNNRPNVSTRLRSRVEDAVRELEYQPNPAAHSLRGGATGLIGFLLDTMANGPIYAAVEQSLRTKAYSMLLTNT